MATEETTTTGKPIDRKEVELLINEVHKVGWGISDLTKILKNEFTQMVDDITPGGATPFLFQTLTDAISKLTDQLGPIALNLEAEIGIRCRAKDVYYDLFSVPGEGKKLSEWVNSKSVIQEVRHG